MQNKRSAGRRRRQAVAMRIAGFQTWVMLGILSLTRGWIDAWHLATIRSLNGNRRLGEGVRMLPGNDYSRTTSGDGQASKAENITVTPGKA